MVIFDCNGVLVDSEPLATAVASQEFMRAGFALTPDAIAHYFTGRRPADMFAEVEMAAGRKLPDGFAGTVASATLRRFRAELRATRYAAQALSWLRGRKCVASSSSPDRIRVSLETTDLLRFFEPNLFSASEVRNGKPAPDIFMHAAARMQVDPRDCVAVEDSAGRRRGRSRGRHESDRLRGRRPCRVRARQAAACGRRPRRRHRHARAARHGHRPARVVRPRAFSLNRGRGSAAHHFVRRCARHTLLKPHRRRARAGGARGAASSARRWRRSRRRPCSPRSCPADAAGGTKRPGRCA